MILVDMNQITIAALMAESKGKPQYDEHLIRHIIMNMLRHIKNKHSSKYGEMILCYDSPHSWRKNVFAYYKANRKKNREASDFDWSKLFDFLTTVRKEFTESMPYKVMHLEGAEADDIIAVVCKEYAGGEPIQIISSDTDFFQLQRYRNVHQYSILAKTQITTSDPIKYLFEHVLRGDTSDGIPNYLSDGDTFVTDGKRQKVLTSKKVDALYEQFDTQTADWTQNLENTENYERNRVLIDFECIPDTLAKQIINTFEQTIPAARSKMLDYFMKYQMKHLMEHIGEF